MHKRVRTTTVYITGSTGFALVYVTWKGQTYPKPITRLLSLYAGECYID